MLIVMKYLAAVMAVLLAGCGGGPVRVDAGGDMDAAEWTELPEAEAGDPDASDDPDAPDGEPDGEDGVEVIDWVSYDGEVPEDRESPPIDGHLIALRGKQIGHIFLKRHSKNTGIPVSCKVPFHR